MMSTITGITLLIHQIIGGIPIADKATEIQNIKTHLLPNEVLILKQPCGSHPTIKLDTLIKYKLSNTGTMLMQIGNDLSLKCNNLNIKNITGYYIKDNENNITQRKDW
jgi:hypothetical protein